jgi:glycosyltransferase involved in cell wall biosynthesis
MSVLAESRRVLYVDPPIDLFSTIGRRRRWAKLRGVRQVAERLWVLSPVALSVRSSPDQRLEFYAGLSERVRRAARDLGLSDAIVWSYSPEHMGCVSGLDAALRVYQAADEPAAKSPDPARTSEMEREHIASSDVVFVASAALLKARKGLGNVHRLPNAADRRHFSRVLVGREEAGVDEILRAVGERRMSPRGLESRRGPLVLFGGAAYSWFDWNLLWEVAELRHDWNFVLVGPLGRDVAGSSMPPNVTAVGRRGYDEFPWYIAAADVCVLPLRLNESSHNCDPIVLYEYLLCGKPVVATPFPAALEHGDMVRTASEPGTFAAEIALAMESDSSNESRRARCEFAAANTWEDRVRTALGIIGEEGRGTVRGTERGTERGTDRGTDRGTVRGTERGTDRGTADK